MNYIVLDMEWNQPTPGMVLKYKNDYCLNNEIIQIGAVKLADDCSIIDTFTINIKPSIYKKINSNVKSLTGIDENVLLDAPNISDAINKFRLWCGNDYVFISWGYDDITVLGENLKYFGLDADWLPGCYNLQMIFCAQTDNENRQYSLSYAAEYFKISLDKPLHNALTDAYYTALVCSCLDIEKGISTYRAMVFKDKSIPEHMKNIIFKRKLKAIKGFSNLLEMSEALKPRCHICGKKLDVTKSGNNGNFTYLLIGSCKEHGKFAQHVRINKTDDDTYSALQQYFSIDEYNNDYFVEKAEKLNYLDVKRKKRIERLNLKKCSKDSSSEVLKVTT